LDAGNPFAPPPPAPPPRPFVERIMVVAVVASLAAACLAVTQPFVIPLIWATILTVSTWPVYRRLRDRLGGRGKTAAALMVLLLFLILTVPIVLLIASLAENARAIGGLVGEAPRLRVPGPPGFLTGLPLVGPAIEAFWRGATANAGATLEQVQPYIARATGWLLARGADLTVALFEFLVAIVIAGILYVTGEAALATLRRLVGRLGGGQREVDLLDLAGRTIRGVAVGVMGTAIVQGTLAGLGFLATGAPAPALLGFATFLCAVMQLPTALVLLPVAGWLFAQGMTWQAIALAAWALAVVNTVDNFVRPYLISQGADLPFLLIFVGVVGGLLTWGFVGIFLGATLLAVSYKLFRNWLEDDDPSRPPRTRLIVPGGTGGRGTR
jgi:predicted PurR-regulated permease PerM